MSGNEIGGDSNFDFNAPQFLNFSESIDDDGVDKFFDTAYEENVVAVVDSKETPIIDKSENKVEEYTSEKLPQENGDTINSISSTEDKQVDKEYGVIFQEINSKVEDAKSNATARYIKRKFGPSIQGDDNDGENERKIVAVELNYPGIPICRKKKSCTKTQPFSFEERYKRLLREKQEKIDKILEEDRKKREFHANPIPSFIECSQHNANSRYKDGLVKTAHDCTKREDEPKFKARPATVLYKPPFEPLKNTCLTDVTAIHLNTEERSKKRNEFNLLMKQKEAEIETILFQRKKEEEQALEEEIKRIRKEAVHKAKPAPIFKPVLSIKSNIPLTDPKSPCFASKKLKKIAS